MRLRHITYLCLGLLLMMSCNDDKTENIVYDLSKDAQIYSFTVAASYDRTADSVTRHQDSIYANALTRVRFALNQVAGIIYNPDSLPYGLEPQMVKMTVGFNTLAGGIGKFEIFVPDSAGYYEWNSTDSVDFSKMPIQFRVTALHGNTKDYRLDLRIHQEDPDVIVWNRMNDFITEEGPQKVLMLEDNFYAYSVSTSSASLSTADNVNLIWQEQTLQNFPLSIIVESINVMNNSFYAITTEGNSYMSLDGISWEKQENGQFITAICGILPGKNSNDDVLLVLLRGDDGKNYYGTTTDLRSIDVITSVSSSPNDPSVQPDFPTKGFSATTKYNRAGNDNVLVLTSGIALDGRSLSATWVIRKTEEGLEMSSSARNSFFSGVGVSVFLYDDCLFALAKNKLYYSKSWGAVWSVASSKQNLPSIMAVRSSQSVVVDNRNNIWIFGGVSENNAYRGDSWTGCLNRLKVN